MGQTDPNTTQGLSILITISTHPAFMLTFTVVSTTWNAAQQMLLKEIYLYSVIVRTLKSLPTIIIEIERPSRVQRTPTTLHTIIIEIERPGGVQLVKKIHACGQHPIMRCHANITLAYKLLHVNFNLKRNRNLPG